MTVLRWREEEEDDDVFPDSLRMGLDKLAAGGGFNRSATPADAPAPSGFLTLSGAEGEEVPSNTISGLFLLWSLLELETDKQPRSRSGRRLYF